MLSPEHGMIPYIILPRIISGKLMCISWHHCLICIYKVTDTGHSQNRCSMLSLLMKQKEHLHESTTFHLYKMLFTYK